MLLVCRTVFPCETLFTSRGRAGRTKRITTGEPHAASVRYRKALRSVRSAHRHFLLSLSGDGRHPLSRRQVSDFPSPGAYSAGSPRGAGCGPTNPLQGLQLHQHRAGSAVLAPRHRRHRSSQAEKKYFGSVPCSPSKNCIAPPVFRKNRRRFSVCGQAAAGHPARAAAFFCPRRARPCSLQKGNVWAGNLYFHFRRIML